MTTTIEIDGYEFEVYFTYQPREGDGFNEPAIPEYIELDGWGYGDGLGGVDNEITHLLHSITCAKDALDIELQDKLEQMMKDGGL